MAGFTASIISNTESSEHKRAAVCKLKKDKTKQNKTRKTIEPDITNKYT